MALEMMPVVPISIRKLPLVSPIPIKIYVAAQSLALVGTSRQHAKVINRDESSAPLRLRPEARKARDHMCESKETSLKRTFSTLAQ